MHREPKNNIHSIHPGFPYDVSLSIVSQNKRIGSCSKNISIESVVSPIWEYGNVCCCVTCLNRLIKINILSFIFYDCSSFLWQLVTDLYKAHHKCLSVDNIKILLEIFSSASSHADQLNSEILLQRKLQIACNVLRLPVPRLVHFQKDSYLYYLNFLQNVLSERGSSPKDTGFETEFAAVCEKMLLIYLECAGTRSSQQKPVFHWILPLPPVKKEELGARTSLALSALRALTSLEQTLLKRYISRFFPLVIDLVKSEHSSEEVLSVLKDLFETCIGPIIIES